MTKELLLRLPDSVARTYTGRFVTWGVVKRVDERSVTFTSGIGFGVPEDLIQHAKVGEIFGVETKGGLLGGTICGWWNEMDHPLRRKTDADMERERQEWLDQHEREKAELLEANREEWQRREDALPDWLRERIQTFRERSGEKFERGGWGYELAVCELAALYEKHGYPQINGRTKYDDLPEEIHEYDQREGCSGNQHDVACALVQAHQAGQSLAGTVSALSPITGDPYYEKR